MYLVNLFQESPEQEFLVRGHFQVCYVICQDMFAIEILVLLPESVSTWFQKLWSMLLIKQYFTIIMGRVGSTPREFAELMGHTEVKYVSIIAAIFFSPSPTLLILFLIP